VYGFSALSEAKTGHYELTHKAVPLATLQDEVGHTPRPANTPAELLGLFLGQAESGLPTIA
jgi:hypothetical protein